MNCTSGILLATKTPKSFLPRFRTFGGSCFVIPHKNTMKLQTSRFSNTLALAAPGAILLASHVANAADIFIKFEGIDGESVDEFHKDHVEVLSWSWGMSQSGTTTSGTGAGKVSLQDFHFTRHVDKASPALFLRCATGETIPKVTFKFTRPEAPGADYYVVTLYDVTVTNIQGERPQPVAGTTGTSSGIPTERVSLNFLKIEMDYRPVDPATGILGDPVSASADVETPGAAQ
jgi:type VI secretion system secreted protein Hcp